VTPRPNATRFPYDFEDAADAGDDKADLAAPVDHVDCALERSGVGERGGRFRHDPRIRAQQNRENSEEANL
jgi:hypothetical protein